MIVFFWGKAIILAHPKSYIFMLKGEEDEKRKLDEGASLLKSSS